MNFRNNKTANKGGTVSINGSSYVLTRSDFFYFLEVINYEKELYKSDSSLTATPNVIFYKEDGSDKVILDYSKSNMSDKKYLNSFFAGLPVNTGISLINGSYLQEAKSINADLSCNLKFKQFKNNYVFTELNSVTNKDSKVDIYPGDYFLKTPQLQSGISLGISPITKSIALVNHKINNSLLSYLGLRKDDYIEIININSTNTNKKIKIKSYESFSDRELLFVYDDLISESLIGMPVLINLYSKTNSQPKEPINPTDTTDLGCCVTATDPTEAITIRSSLSLQTVNNTATASAIINGTTINLDNTNLVKNTTRKQCEIITGNINSFVPGCISTITTTTASNTFSEDVQYFASPVFYANISFINDAFTFLPITTNTLTYYKLENNILYLRPNLTYRFNQTDQSNSNKIIRFSTDEDKTQLYQNDIWGKQTLTGIGSIIYIKINESTPTLYMHVSNNSSVSPITIKLLI